jgi:hypothetical protein
LGSQDDAKYFSIGIPAEGDVLRYMDEGQLVFVGCLSSVSVQDELAGVNQFTRHDNEA